MSEAILSQDEMDALLKGVQSGQVDTLMSTAQNSAVRPYDLMNLNHYVTLHPNTAIKVVFEPFMVPLQIALARELRKEVTVAQPLIAMNKFDAFLETISEGSSFNLIKIEPLTDEVLLILTADLVYLLLEHFYGGGKMGYTKGRGDYTLIEKRFVRKIVDILLLEFQKGWAKIRPVQISVMRSDSTARTMKILSDKDWVITAQFKITISGGTEQDFFFCFPFAHLEPLREKLYGGQGVVSVSQTDTARADMVHYIGENGWVKVSGLVGRAALRVPEIIKLEAGDIIMLDRNINDDFELMIQNHPKFYGRPGKCKEKQAFQIRSLILPKKI